MHLLQEWNSYVGKVFREIGKHVLDGGKTCEPIPPGTTGVRIHSSCFVWCQNEVSHNDNGIDFSGSTVSTEFASSQTFSPSKWGRLHCPERETWQAIALWWNHCS